MNGAYPMGALRQFRWNTPTGLALTRLSESLDQTQFGRNYARPTHLLLLTVR